MDLKLAKAEADEAEDAKSFWAETEFQHRGYDADPPFYAKTISKLVEALGPDSIFEFGCNAGRNLALIRKTNETARLLGVDINAESIAHGKKHFEGLDLRTADEGFLQGQPVRSWDVVFTISVLDHIPDIEETFRNLARLTSRVLILLEPHGDAEGRVDEYKQAGAQNWKAATPYSYLHDYDTLLREQPFNERINIALPTGPVRLGPLYRLRVLERNDSAISADFWQTQRDEISRNAVLELMRWRQLLRVSSKELKEEKSSTAKLRKELAAEREKTSAHESAKQRSPLSHARDGVRGFASRALRRFRRSD